MRDAFDTTPLPAGADLAATIDAAITSRRSVRGFLPTPVPRATIEHLLEVASRAPSGTNMQPWRVYVLTGQAKAALTAAILAARDQQRDDHATEFKYYPSPFFEPYLARRRKIGWDLYGLLGIEKGDKDKMARQHARNFDFFGAPVGIMFTIDRDLARMFHPGRAGGGQSSKNVANSPTVARSVRSLFSGRSSSR